MYFLFEIHGILNKKKKNFIWSSSVLIYILGKRLKLKPGKEIAQ